ncbi:putative DNA recombination and repair protein Rad54B [Naematelia encephala]|uniref:Putative DNA recombination and repair protein Rad54B n=1 Tax=Naematelia encephala TaxID=71784 RepID=A0A1Y2B0W7_9TREE|nr:putative DNA recombination and repair protein Rad54B [Naematelia encephala]
MLRRHPSNTKPGDALLTSATAAGFGLITKPFKAPTALAPKRELALPARKRKAVSYKGQGGDGDDENDSDAERPSKKGKFAMGNKEYGEDGVLGDMAKWCNRKFPVFAPKDKTVIFGKSFSIPIMVNARTSETIVHSLSHASLGARRHPILTPRPLHDPMDDHAIVLFDPTIDDRPDPQEIEEELREAEKRRKEAETRGPHRSLKAILGIADETTKKKDVKVPVVIDPRLSKILRPHQVEGVKFLYRCTTGLLAENAWGCIMADEMGLGKTLQCITLLWTLLKQSPTAGKPTCEKAIVACPTSLVGNWANELVKWLGPGAINPLVVDGKGGKAELIPQVRRWAQAHGRNVTLPVMIVSYETLRTLQDELVNCPIGLLLADEGHRLKNADTLTFKALTTLNVQRRVILTGTPIQNDLSEYFALLSFANPDYLGSKADFKKNFEAKILRGRDADATEKERVESDAKLKELGSLVSKFIIRRTNDLLSKYLPVKYEHVVFCRPSPLQAKLYNLFVTSPDVQRLLRGKDSQPLKAIGLLKKLVNHPHLLDLPADLPGSEKFMPAGYDRKARTLQSEYSGKFVVLERMLDHIHKHTDDKIVLISNATQTLDLMAKMCRIKKYGFVRLDGSLDVKKRSKIVDRFNDPSSKEFVFLLSSKAGGCGINLIGANRLILFDPDWNPASDQQALARVWRDGQKKECFVYRFQTTGTIEEKIFQRQCQKQNLSACVVDEAEDTARHFTQDDLRQLFKFNTDTLCDTHDTYKCKRCKDGRQFAKATALLYGDASTWNHFPNSELGKMHDDLLRAELGLPEVSYVFQYISH